MWFCEMLWGSGKLHTKEKLIPHKGKLNTYGKKGQEWKVEKFQTEQLICNAKKEVEYNE